MRSIDVVVRELCAAVVDGKNQRVVVSREEEPAKRDRGDARAPAGSAPRRSRRARYRADDAQPQVVTEEAPKRGNDDDAPQSSKGSSDDVEAKPVAPAVETTPAVAAESNDA